MPDQRSAESVRIIDALNPTHHLTIDSSGTIAVRQMFGAPWAVSGTISIGNSPNVGQTAGPWAVSGTVSLGNSPNVGQTAGPWAVSGTISIGNRPDVGQTAGPWAVSGTVFAVITGGSTRTDNTLFSDGVSSYTPIGAFVNDLPTSGTVAEDFAATLRMTPKRALHTNLRDSSGTELGTPVVPLAVSGSIILANSPNVGQTAGPWAVSGTVTLGASPNVGQTAGPWAVSGTLSIANFPAPGTQTVSGRVAVDLQGPVAVSGTISIGNSPNVGQTAGPWAISGTVTTSVNIPQPLAVSGNIGQTAGPWAVSGTVFAIITGGSIRNDNTAFTDSLSAFTPIGAVVNDLPASGSIAEDFSATLRMTPKRALHMNLRDSSGSELGTPAVPLAVSGLVTLGASPDVGQTRGPWAVSGTVTASLAIPQPLAVSGTVSVNTHDVRQTAGPWAISGTVISSVAIPQPLAVSGTVNVSGLGNAGAVVSTVNSTTGIVAANLQFVGTSEAVQNYAAIEITIFSLQASHTSGGVECQFSTDNVNWDVREVFNYVASGTFSICVRPKGQYFRLVYTNGAAPQTVFRCQTIYSYTSPYTAVFEENERIALNGVSYRVKQAAINITANTDTTIVAAVTQKKLRVLSISLTSSVITDITFKSGANTLISAMSIDKRSSLTENYGPYGYLTETNVGEAFILNSSGGGNVRGLINYIEV